MPQQLKIVVTPKDAADNELLKAIICNNLQLKNKEITSIKIIKRSTDARKKVKINLTVNVYLEGEEIVKPTLEFKFNNVNLSPEIIIVGAGPAGLFSALRLIELGFKPIIIERGKDINNRKRDIALLCRGKGLNPESNYCFGEGGAGAFSDGKLYTRSNKRGNIDYVLKLLVYHGASEDILIDSQPHIGSDLLPVVISNIRKTIIDCGGEIHFEQRVKNLIIKDGKVTGVKTDSQSNFEGKAVILATGHSASDIYEMFYSNNYLLESKPFALGVRVEHRQEQINEVQYRRSKEIKYLAPATYKLTSQIEGRGVYSFCMCPGGYIVPASTSIDGQVVNGMSTSKRHTAFANSAIIVETRIEDTNMFKQNNELSGLYYQKYLETLARKHGCNNQIAPAQQITDFVNRKFSNRLIESSYLPSIVSSPLHSWLPEGISSRLIEAFKYFDKKMQGFITSEALVVGVETRSSTPVRIPRDKESMMHPQFLGLYPCGEGSGYAGGITSSAIDGIVVAERIAGKLGGHL